MPLSSHDLIPHHVITSSPDRLAGLSDDDLRHELTRRQAEQERAAAQAEQDRRDAERRAADARKRARSEIDELRRALDALADPADDQPGPECRAAARGVLLGSGDFAEMISAGLDRPLNNAHELSAAVHRAWGRYAPDVPDSDPIFRELDSIQCAAWRAVKIRLELLAYGV